MEITLKEIFSILKNKLFIILVTALAFGLMAFGCTKFILPKTYTTTAKLYVETKNDGSQSSYNNLTAFNYAVALVNTYMEMLDTNRFYTQVSKVLNEKYTPTELSNMIEFSSLKETEVFQAYVKADSPKASMEIIEAVIKVAPTIFSDASKESELKILDDPVVPTSPSAPNVAGSTAVAFLGGAVLAIAIVILRRILNVKIQYTEDMTSVCGVPLLGTIPSFETVMKNSKSHHRKKEEK